MLFVGSVRDIINRDWDDKSIKMLFTPRLTRKQRPSDPRNGLKKSSPDLNREPRGKIIEKGILLIKTDDPIGKLFQLITQQEYSCIGIYKIYQTYQTHKLTSRSDKKGNKSRKKSESNEIRKETEIEIYDIFTGSKSHETIHDSITSSEILSDIFSNITPNRSISEIIVYPLDTTERELLLDKSTENLNQSIVTLFTNYFDLPVLKSLSKLVDRVFDRTHPNPIRDLIETGLKLNKERIIYSERGSVGLNSHDKPNNRSPPSKDSELKEIITTFVDMLLSDENFFNLVTERYFNKKDPCCNLYDIVKDDRSLQDGIISFLHEYGQSKTIDKSILDEIRNRSSDTPNNIVMDKINKSEIINAVKSLHHQMDTILQTVRNKQIPLIEINSMVKEINTLSEHLIGQEGQKDRKDQPIPLKPINTALSGVLVVSPEGSVPIPLTLKKGNEIILTTRNFNLTIFTRDELVEILEYIEKVTPNDAFISLRREIIKQIVKKQS